MEAKNALTDNELVENILNIARDTGHELGELSELIQSANESAGKYLKNISSCANALSGGPVEHIKMIIADLESTVRFK